MSNSTLWWVLTGVLVAVELTTGTFYLLMMALGGVAGAIAAHAGVSATGQMVFAAVVGAGAVTAWHLLRGKSPNSERATANKDVNLDIGETVVVEAWLADGTATVKYRGAAWSAGLAPGAVAGPGPHRIVEVLGNRLILQPL